MIFHSFLRFVCCTLHIEGLSCCKSPLCAACASKYVCSVCVHYVAHLCTQPWRQLLLWCFAHEVPLDTNVEQHDVSLCRTSDPAAANRNNIARRIKQESAFAVKELAAKAAAKQQARADRQRALLASTTASTRPSPPSLPAVPVAPPTATDPVQSDKPRSAKQQQRQQKKALKKAPIAFATHHPAPAIQHRPAPKVAATGSNSCMYTESWLL